MPEQTSHSHAQQASSTPTLSGQLQAGAAQPSTQHTNSTSSAFSTQSEIADTAIVPAAAQGWVNWAYSGVPAWFSTGTQTTQTTTDNAAAADNPTTTTATGTFAAAVMNASSASSPVPVHQVSAAEDTGNADAGRPMSALSETTSVLAEYAVDDFDRITGFVSELWDSTSSFAFDLVGGLLVPDGTYGDLTQEELMWIAQDTAQPSRPVSPETPADDSFTGTIPTAFPAETPSSAESSWLSWPSWLSWWGAPASSSSAAPTTEHAPTLLDSIYQSLPSMHTVAFCAFAAAVHFIGRPTADGNHCRVVHFDMT